MLRILSIRLHSCGLAFMKIIFTGSWLNYFTSQYFVFFSFPLAY